MEDMTAKADIENVNIEKHKRSISSDKANIKVSDKTSEEFARYSERKWEEQVCKSIIQVSFVEEN